MCVCVCVSLDVFGSVIYRKYPSHTLCDKACQSRNSHQTLTHDLTPLSTICMRLNAATKCERRQPSNKPVNCQLVACRLTACLVCVYIFWLSLTCACRFVCFKLAKVWKCHVMKYDINTHLSLAYFAYIYSPRSLRIFFVVKLSIFVVCLTSSFPSMNVTCEYEFIRYCIYI